MRKIPRHLKEQLLELPLEALSAALWAFSPALSRWLFRASVLSSLPDQLWPGWRGLALAEPWEG